MVALKAIRSVVARNAIIAPIALIDAPHLVREVEHIPSIKKSSVLFTPPTSQQCKVKYL